MSTVTQGQLDPEPSCCESISSLEKSLPYWLPSLMAHPFLIDSQVIHPSQDSFYSLALTGPSLEPVMNLTSIYSINKIITVQIWKIVSTCVIG
jgi:hypothetical protein